MFNRFQRSERALLVACADMYFQGISTRRVQDVLETMCGTDISAATVSLRKKMNSTNMLENIMRRLKARTRVVCIFPNRQSCDRLIGALLMEIHEDWQTAERPYLRVLK
jgi:transposase-like protein